MRRYCAFITSGRLALVVALAILVLSLVPGSNSLSAPGNDKLHHLAAYGTLSFLVFYRCRRLGEWATSAALVLAFGFAIEVVQPYFARAFEWADMASNSAGVAAGAFLILAVRTVLRHEPREL